MYTDYSRGPAPRPNPPYFHRGPPSPAPPLGQRSPRLQAPAPYQGAPEYHNQQYPREPSPNRLQFDQYPSHPHQPPISPDPPSADTIKCSSCSSWVHLDSLGDHTCGKESTRPSNGNARGGGGRREDTFPRELRVDVRAAGPKGYGQNQPSRSPMYPGHLEATPPHTPGSSLSRPTSPALSAHSDQFSRSISSNSSASSSVASGGSSSRLPFFERYNKLVGVGNGGGGGDADVSGGGSAVNMAGVGMRNLDIGSARSPRAEGFAINAQVHNRSRSPSPNPSAFAQSPPAHQPQLRSPRVEQSCQIPDRTEPYQPLRNQPLRSLNPLESSFRPEMRALHPGNHPAPPSPSVDRHEPLQVSPASPFSPSMASEPLPAADHAQPTGLARSTSNSSSIHSTESAYIAYDRRETLKPPTTKPTISRAQSTKSSGSQGGGSISSLDALEDLLLMAREEAADDVRLDEGDDGSNDRNDLQDDFLAPSKRDQRQQGTTQWSDLDEAEDVTTTPRAPVRIPTSKSVPSLAPFSSSHSSSRSGGLPASGSSPNLSSTLGSSSTSFDCTTCRKHLKPSQIQKAGDGQLFCRACYAERYLPKCRKCQTPIEGGAVTSSDGKVLGKYHPACFSCFSCSKSFPSGDFYVFDGKPYCQYDYHALNGSLCTNRSCGTPIEGPCVSLVGEDNGGGGRYHPNCFVCSVSTCSIPLLEHHFVVDRLPYCETHSSGTRPPPRDASAGSQSTSPQTSRARKRQTIITRR